MSLARRIVVGNTIVNGGETGGPTGDRYRTWTPWLLIPYATSDAGARPIPDGVVSWASPNIWVESSDLWGNAVAGEENFVHARVFNLGKAPAIPTRVDFYWGDPSLGLGPGKMTYIGTEWARCDPHRGTHVRCSTPWIPTFLNGGHECLMVQCIGPVLEDVQGTVIGPPYPLQPQIDRHVAQRNVTVLATHVGEKLVFGVGVYNPFPLAAVTRVSVRVHQLLVTSSALRAMSHGEIVRHVAAFDARSPGPDAIVADARQLGGGHGIPEIRATLTEHGSIVPSPSGRAYLGQMLLAADRRESADCVDTRDDIELHRGTLGAFENRRLDLELTARGAVQPGEFIVFHVMQITADLAVGGYTIVVRVIGDRAGR